MANSHQDLRNAIQAMNKAVAVRVVQIKRGEVVPEGIAGQVNDSSSVDEMVRFLDTTIANEKEKKDTSPEVVDERHETEHEKKPIQPSVDPDLEESTTPDEAQPTDSSQTHPLVKPDRQKPDNSRPADAGVEQQYLGRGSEENTIEHQSQRPDAPTNSPILQPETKKESEKQIASLETQDTSVGDAITIENETQLGERTTATDISREAQTSPVVKNGKAIKSTELIVDDEVSDSVKRAENARVPARLWVLCIVLLVLVSVFVMLNFSQIESLLVQWISRVEYWLMNLSP